MTNSPAADMAPVLSIRNLCHAYGGKPLLKNISLDFHPSTLTLITGPNGAGKTTFLKIAAGLTRPDRGKAILAQNAAPAYLGHENMFYPALSAMENLSFWVGLGQSPPTAETIREVLAEAGLAKHPHTPVGKFSRGMIQKLQIARILLLRANLILLDEPATGLDVQSRNFLRKKALELRGKGACILMVSHDAQRDASMADTLLNLEQCALRPCKNAGESLE